MKKNALWIAIAVALIAVLALVLVPQLSGKDETLTPTASPVVTDAAATDAPADSTEPTANATAEPVADTADATGDVAADAADTAEASTTTDPATVLATVNGQEIKYEDVDVVAQNLMYNYSMYGYDFSDESMVQAMYQMAMDYSIQLALMEQKATEWGFDQMTDEEKATLETEVAAEWENLVETYITYYGNLADNATDEDKAAARVSAIAGLEAMGYTEAVLLEDATESAKFDKVEAEMIKGAEVTDEEVKAAFDEKVAADELSYSQDVATYEYMTNYYGETSYYQPEGYRGITHILLQVDEELLTNYQDLTAQLEEQQEAEEEATEATPTDAVVTQADVDAAYAAIIASVQPTIDEINAKLAAGTSFAELIAEYGTDPGMESEPYKTEGYPVHIDSVVWDPVFTQAAFSVDQVGDIAEPVVGSYGVHIVQYTCDIPAGAVELTEDISASLREELLATKENELFNSTMETWLTAAEVSYTAEGATYAPTSTEE